MKKIKRRSAKDRGSITGRSTCHCTRWGKGSHQLFLKQRKPEIKGVLVVAGGAENMQVKKWIIEAVTRALMFQAIKLQ